MKKKKYKNIRLILKKNVQTFSTISKQNIPAMTTFTEPLIFSFCPRGFPAKNTGLGCDFFLQGIFLTQVSNLCPLHWQAGFLPLSHQGSPVNAISGQKERERERYFSRQIKVEDNQTYFTRVLKRVLQVKTKDGKQQHESVYESIKFVGKFKYTGKFNILQYCRSYTLITFNFAPEVKIQKVKPTITTEICQ